MSYPRVELCLSNFPLTEDKSLQWLTFECFQNLGFESTPQIGSEIVGHQVFGWIADRIQMYIPNHAVQIRLSLEA